MKHPAVRRFFHDDQFYQVGQEQGKTGWFARLLFPFFSTKVHTAEDQAGVHEKARAEIRALKTAKHKRAK